MVSRIEREICVNTCTVKQAAKALRITERAVYALIYCGQIRAAKRKGRWQVTKVTAEHLIPTRTLADSMNCSSRYIRQLITDGRVQAVRVGGQWRIPINEAAKLMVFRLGVTT